MTEQGPLLDRLTRRLADCPEDFLLEPKMGKRGQVLVEAVVFDVLLALGGRPPRNSAPLQPFRQKQKRARNLMRLVLIACWLLHDEELRQRKRVAERALSWLSTGLEELARLVSAELFISDADRREELARLCLAALDLRPKGETEKQASDRLRTLDSVEREQVIRKSRAQQERARRLREAMQQEAAREAAARYSRE